jgi:restriction endonuclease S subunit
MITVSIIQKSQLEGTLRLDAEYYQPEYLNLNSKLKSQKSKFLKDLAKNIICGPFGSAILQEDYRDAGVPLIRVADLNDWFVGDEDLVFIDDFLSQEMKRYQVISGDIVVSQRGTIAMFSKVTDKFSKWNISANLISIKKSENINFDYLLAFLNSSYGINQLYRRLSGQVQPKITTDDVKQILVFLPDIERQNEIAEFIQQSWKEQEKSKSLYSEAENLLLEELGLKDFKDEDDLSYIVNLSEIKSIHRADAEYFQPKYEKIDNILKKFRQEKLENLSSLISYGTVPTSPYVEEYGIPYVKGENLQNCFIDYSKLVYLDKESTKKLPRKFYLKKDDIVISQMGTVGRAGLVSEKEEGWLFASFTIRVRLKEDVKSFFNPLFVTLYIQNISRPYYLLRKIAQASVRQNTDLPTIRELKVSILPKPTQQKIADLVQKSHEARKKAKQLLEEAKQKVEKIIEIE